MAIHVLQSQSIEHLFQHFSVQVQQYRQQLSVFSSIQVIVPSHGVGYWLKQRLAEQQGIHANINYQALRTVQWQLYQQILGQKRVAAAPHMLNMKWRIFLFLQQYWQKPDLPDEHPLQHIFQHIRQYYPQEQPTRQDIALKQQNMLYWVADHCSRLFANYMIYRGECVQGCPQGHCRCRQNWLFAWGKNQPLSMSYGLLRDEQPQFPMKNEQQPTDNNHDDSPQKQHQLQRVTQLEAWQRFIWYEAFATDFRDIQYIDQAFWQVLHQYPDVRQKLPARIFIFTLLELPPAQLLFLQRLGEYIDVIILHYSPSQQYFADSVDPRWKAKFSLENPQKAKYYDSHHALLTRLGKQARDHSALLMQLSGGDFGGQWIDDFKHITINSLLKKLQADILDLATLEDNHYTLLPDDRSIQFHVCHSTVRQLEILKEQLLHWLDDADAKCAGEQRRPSDILILVPDLQRIAPLIRTVFSHQHEQYQGNLPIKITGIAPLDAIQLWQAIRQRMQLLQHRFSLTALIDWLSLLPIQHYYGLNYEQIQRIQQLLTWAGFRRGFDEQHLKQSLSDGDQDYRFSFLYALQRLSYAVAVPEQALFNHILGLEHVQREDFALISILLNIYQDLDARRDWLALKEQHDDVEQQLALIEREILDFQQQAGFTVVEQAVKNLRRILRVSLQHEVLSPDTSSESALRLPLQYLLDEIANSVEHQLSQTEPTGQITFAEMGQLRPLPYRLIVCLNLDAGVFPNREHRIPFDLMAELRGELGDRSRLEDDHGSFLDALLQAQDQFWVFYNGFDADSQSTREPSSIVQELLQHLQVLLGDISLEMNNIKGLTIAKVLQPLFHIHTLQPFAGENFTATQPLSYATQWFKVAEQLYNPQNHRESVHWLNHDNSIQEQYQAGFLKLESSQWSQDLGDPAHHFIRSIGVSLPRQQVELNDFESLNVDYLEQYQLQHRLYIHQQKNREKSSVSVPLQATLQDILPIGHVQNPVWKIQQADYQQLWQCVLDYDPTGITLCESQLWQYPYSEQFGQQRIEFAFQRPVSATTWLSFTIKTLKGKRWLEDWVNYLLWRASETTEAVLVYIRVYQDVHLKISGLSQHQAIEQLHHWIKVWFLAQQKPFVLPPELILGFCGQKKLFENAEQYMSIKPKMIQKWLSQPSFGRDFDMTYYQNHKAWQWLIPFEQAEQQLAWYMDHYLYDLYFVLEQHCEKITLKD